MIDTSLGNLKTLEQYRAKDRTGERGRECHSCSHLSSMRAMSLSIRLFFRAFDKCAHVCGWVTDRHIHLFSRLIVPFRFFLRHEGFEFLTRESLSSESIRNQPLRERRERECVCVREVRECVCEKERGRVRETNIENGEVV